MLMTPGVLRRNRQVATAAEPVYHPTLWGAALWKVLHVLAEKPTENLTSWITLIDKLKSALPCPECRGHFVNFVGGHPLTAAKEVREWLLALHNDVNRRNGVAVWSSAQLTDSYSSVDISAVVREQLPTVQQYIGSTVVGMIEGMI